MQSNGGLCPWYKFTVEGNFIWSRRWYGRFWCDLLRRHFKKATIGFDAGGTSTDVSRYAGNLEHIYETVVSEINLQTPQLDISTVAAGGGSMLFWKMECLLLVLNPLALIRAPLVTERVDL